MNAFVVAGLILAGWAVVVGLLGMRGFPSSRTGERIAIAITAVLFAGALTGALADQSKVGERRGKEIDKPGEGEETKKPGEPTEGGGAGAGEPTGEAPPKDEGEQKGGKTTGLTLSADPSGQLSFDKNALEAPAGQVTIAMTNPSPVPHNVALKGNGVQEKGEVVQGNDKSSVEAMLEPGLSYVFYCSVPGHEQGGMKGTLTVK